LGPVTVVQKAITESKKAPATLPQAIRWVLARPIRAAEDAAD